MISEKRAKWSVILFMLTWCGLLLFGFEYMVSLKIPVADQLKAAAQEEDNRPLMSNMGGSSRLREDELGAREIKKKYAAAEPIYNRLMAEYKKIPRFHPPANNRLTEKQVLALNDVYMTGVIAYRNFDIYDLGTSRHFFKAVASYAYIPVLIENAKLEGLVKHQMTEEEMYWVLHREMEAALFACNVQWDLHQGPPEEIENLKRTRIGLASLVGLMKEMKPEEGGTQHYPERLDSSKIPRDNVALVLKLQDHVRWVEVRFFMLTLNQAKIMQAANSLPE